MPRLLLSTVPLALTLLGFGCSASAPITTDGGLFTTPVAVSIEGYWGDVMEPFLSRDGRFLFFNNRNDPAEQTDLRLAEALADGGFRSLGLLEGANSTALDGVASLDRSGGFYFVSTRSYATSLSSLWRGQFTDGGVTDVELVSGLSRSQAGWVNFDAEISGDGSTLWFVDGHFSGGAVPDSADILFAMRQGTGFVRSSDSGRVLGAVNSSALEYAPCVSADGRELFFTRLDATAPGAPPSIWRATRRSSSDPFGTPTRVVEAGDFVEAATLSPDERTLYFHQLVGGAFMLQRMSRR